LASWQEGRARDDILGFVEAAQSVPEVDRVAVFDNDGTLWCEKPMPIQLDFILRRLYEMAEADPDLRDRQPWKAAYERDYGWLASTIAEHYAGDETKVRTLAAGSLAAHGAAPNPRPRLSRDGVRADGRAARLPGGERLLELHRLGRRP
jgi:hypothetical protein